MILALFGELVVNPFPDTRNFYVEVIRYRRMVMIDVHANAFLLHMVRNIVGVLVAVG